MNARQFDVDFVKTKIKEAFANVPHPKEKMIDPNSPSSEIEIKCFLSKKWTSWETIPRNIIDYKYGVLSFFSPEGLQFILPAYMICALEDPESNVDDFTVYHLTPPEQENNQKKWNYFIEKFSKFTNKQREAIVIFLKYQKYRMKDDPTNYAAIALERYWNQSINPHCDS